MAFNSNVLTVGFTLYSGHPTDTLRLASQRLWYDTLQLCVVIFVHCLGREKLYELSIMLR